MKLFVGNLSYHTTEATLRDEFEAIGPVVEVKVITDRDTGKSRGFAFVSMASQVDADEAIAKLNKADVDGRPIVVDKANERAPRPAGSARSGSSRGRW